MGVLDTDSDPDTVDVAIPANDDSIRAVEIILNELGRDAVAIGKTMVSARQQEVTPRPRRVRSRRPTMARADGGQVVADHRSSNRRDTTAVADSATAVADDTKAAVDSTTTVADGPAPGAEPTQSENRRSWKRRSHRRRPVPSNQPPATDGPHQRDLRHAGTNAET